MKSFYQWLEDYEPESKFAYDFKCDAMLDQDFPRDAGTRREVMAYLEDFNFCDNARAGFNMLWSEYIRNIT